MESTSAALESTSLLFNNLSGPMASTSAALESTSLQFNSLSGPMASTSAALESTSLLFNSLSGPMARSPSPQIPAVRYLQTNMETLDGFQGRQVTVC